MIDRLIDLRLSAVEVPHLRETLRLAWECMTGRAPSSLERDLKVLRKWFGPVTDSMVASGLVEMPPLSDNALSLAVEHPRLLIVVQDTAVVTPEGRVVLGELIEAAPGTPFTMSVAARERLNDLYLTWAIEKVTVIAARRRGDGPPMNPAAVAAVLLLLLHGAGSRDTALVVPYPSDAIIDEALCAPVNAFTNAFSSRARTLTESIQNHPIRQAQDRLGPRAVCRIREADGTLLWVPSDNNSWSDVLDVLAGELSRHKESDFDRALRAFDAMSDVYVEQVLPVFRAVGIGSTADADLVFVPVDFRKHLKLAWPSEGGKSR